MDYNYKPHETNYGNRIYRSRLEARWARFFDKLGWKYEYEPFDLGHWSPDFIIYPEPEDYRYILIEVKPKIMVDKELLIKLSSSFPIIEDNKNGDEYTWLNCTKSEYKFWILLLYEDININNGNPCNTKIGDLVYSEKTLDDCYFKLSKKGYDISSYVYDWDGMLSPFSDSNRKYFIENRDIYGKDIIKMWTDSANEVRYIYKK